MLVSVVFVLLNCRLLVYNCTCYVNTIAPAIPETNIRKKFSAIFRGHDVIFLHASKTAGSASKLFTERCMGVDASIIGDNYLNRVPSAGQFFEVVHSEGNHTFVGSHISSEKSAYDAITSMTTSAVVVVPVRTWKSWFTSAVIQCATRYATPNGMDLKSCGQGEIQKGADVVSSTDLFKSLNSGCAELNACPDNIFDAVLRADKDGLLKARVIFLHISHVNTMYEIISETLCPHPLTAQQLKPAANNGNHISAQKNKLYVKMEHPNSTMNKKTSRCRLLNVEYVERRLHNFIRVYSSSYRAQGKRDYGEDVAKSQTGFVEYIPKTIR